MSSPIEAFHWSRKKSSRVGNRVKQYPVTLLILEGQLANAVAKGSIDRKPWKQSKPIDIPTAPSTNSRYSGSSFFEKTDPESLGSDSSSYMSLLVYNRIAKHMTWKRLMGSVKEYIVVEGPLV